MKSVTIKIAMAFISATFAVFPLFSCHKQTEADKVKKVVADVRKAAEEKDIKTILNDLSKTYRDPQGNDYDGIKTLLLYYFFKHQKVSVYITGLDASVSGGTAKAVFQAVLTGGNKVESPGDLLPEALGVYNFDVLFLRESGEWKVTSAKWEWTGESPPGTSK